MVFRRRRARPEPQVEEPAETPPASDEGTPARTGPWDEADLASPRDGRIDLGALLVPAVQGLQVGLERSDNHIVAVRLQVGESTLQLMALAAPRTAGIWAEVRAEIAADVAKRGGTVDETTGPFGPELRATLPARSRDGRKATQRARFIGVDGPRWLLRGVITGRATTDHHQAELFEKIFRDVVVVRGKDPMAPRDLIPLRLPASARPEPSADGIDSESSSGQEIPEVQ